MSRSLQIILVLFTSVILQLAPAKAAEEALTEEQLVEADVFIFNNALHVLFHEAGHMLISEFGIPVLGREEDAVDNLSTMIMLEAQNEAFDVAIQDATDGWLLLDLYSDNEIDDFELMDTHGLDAQRAFNTVCMMTGADPEFFAKFADSLDFPDERREECAFEYEQMRDSWQTMLEPYLVEEGEDASRFDISYAEPEEGYELFADILKKGEALEVLADVVGSTVKLDDGIALTARNCGEPNAFWDPQARKITYCYELAELHGDVIVTYLQKNPEQ